MELPAGLIDEGEDAAYVHAILKVGLVITTYRTTALRELHEETGFGGGKPDKDGEAQGGDGQGKGKVGFVSPVLVSDPGYVTVIPRHRSSLMIYDRMSGANMNLVTVDIYMGENDPEPEQKLEPVRRLSTSDPRQ